jgi:hypothetical protein
MSKGEFMLVMYFDMDNFIDQFKALYKRDYKTDFIMDDKQHCALVKVWTSFIQKHDDFFITKQVFVDYINWLFNYKFTESFKAAMRLICDEKLLQEYITEIKMKSDRVKDEFNPTTEEIEEAERERKDLSVSAAKECPVCHGTKYLFATCTLKFNLYTGKRFGYNCPLCSPTINLLCWQKNPRSYPKGCTGYNYYGTHLYETQIEVINNCFNSTKDMVTYVCNLNEEAMVPALREMNFTLDKWINLIS